MARYPLTWRDLNPRYMVNKRLPLAGVEGPLNEIGERCPWPWDPQQRRDTPMGQYHCPSCGGMQVAGTPHIDWTDVKAPWLNERSHRVPAEPIRALPGEWDPLWSSSCSCGYGITSDSPEAAILAMALHLYKTLPEGAPERMFYRIELRDHPEESDGCLTSPE